MPETGASSDRAARAASGQMAFSLRPLDDPATLEPLWIDLERRAEPSFFLSWQWIGNWLRTLPAGIRPWLLSLRDDRGAITGLAVLTPRRVRRLGVLRIGQWWLHETGDPGLDAPTIEDNGILLAGGPSAKADLAARSLRWVLDNAPDCDELVIGGIGPELTAALRRAAGPRHSVRLRQETIRPYVDLGSVRAAGGDYLALLGRNTRQAVRRAVRLYEESGSLRLRIAEDPDEALDYLARLKALHQAHWVRRGQAGAFAPPYFERFHRRLIRDHFATGSIQLCRIAAGSREIGYLYNFVWRGWVHAYQSGLAYDDDNRLKPGLVSHYLAIRRALEDGLGTYDFMAGDGQHKRNLSTHAAPMAWLTLTGDRLPLRIEGSLRRLKTRLAGNSERKRHGFAAGRCATLDENDN